MRLLLSLFVASLVGSTLVGGLKVYLANGTTDHTTLAQLAKRDPTTVISLIKESVPLCFPELGQMQSRKGREILPRMVAKVLELKLKSPTGDQKEEMKAWMKENVLTSFQSLSKRDADILESAVRKTVKDKTPIQCIGAYVLQNMATHDVPKPLFSDTKLRGT